MKEKKSDVLCVLDVLERREGHLLIKNRRYRGGPRAYAPATASAFAPGFGQWPGNRRLGAVWPVNRALFGMMVRVD